MTTKPAVAVLMGGQSAEREVSLESGAGILRALTSLGYPAWSIDFDGSFVERMRERRPDAVFIALHGGAGEDGRVQALLDWLDIPYQGSGVHTSVVALDKWFAKAVMTATGLPTPRAVVLDVPNGRLPSPPADFAYPFMVKPRGDGSAVGVSIVRKASDWEGAVRGAMVGSSYVLVEDYIAGREFTIGILEDAALPVVGIEPNDEFYTYKAKYTAGGATHTVPAKISPELARSLQDLALRFHHALGCRDYSRVDIMTDRGGKPYLLECNTLPGFTSLSLFPEAAAAAGIPFESLIGRLVACALSRRRN